MSESASQDHDLARLDSGFLNLKLQPQNRAGRQTWFTLPHSPTATIVTGTIGEVLDPMVPKLFDQIITHKRASKSPLAGAQSHVNAVKCVSWALGRQLCHSP